MSCNNQSTLKLIEKNQIIPHPNGFFPNYNIGLIKLNQTIDVLSQKYIEVVKWPQVNQTIVEGYDCLALTWGKSKKNNQKCQFCLILI